MKRMKLMAEYYGRVLWWADGEQVGPIGLDELTLPQELELRLRQWGAFYHNRLDWDDPASTSPWTENEIDHFEAEGLAIWAELQRVFNGEWEVLYFSEKQQKVLTP